MAIELGQTRRQDVHTIVDRSVDHLNKTNFPRRGRVTRPAEGITPHTDRPLKAL